MPQETDKTMIMKTSHAGNEAKASTAATTAKPGEEITMNTDELQENFMRAQQRLEQLRERQQGVLQLLQENLLVYQAIQAIKNGDEYESVIPLGAGIFVKGKIRAKELLRNIPGDIAVPSNVKEIEADLADRKKIFERELELLSKQMSDANIIMHNSANLLKTFEMMQKNKKR
jgi:prefoldin subunit 5